MQLILHLVQVVSLLEFHSYDERNKLVFVVSVR